MLLLPGLFLTQFFHEWEGAMPSRKSRAQGFETFVCKTKEIVNSSYILRMDQKSFWKL